MLKMHAEKMLLIAEKMNPGSWADHSKTAAHTAEAIAKECGMDGEKAYAMGLLHDIGRREGVTDMKHIFDGYLYLMSEGYEEIAHICLTHSFPIQDVSVYQGKYDCTKGELAFLQAFLVEFQYDDYHRLIQLCDALSLPQGAVLMEKRLVDVAMRHRMKDFLQRKWQAYLDLKAYFDKKAGCSIYALMPNVIDNTFEGIQ